MPEPVLEAVSRVCKNFALRDNGMYLSLSVVGVEWSLSSTRHAVIMEEHCECFLHEVAANRPAASSAAPDQPDVVDTVAEKFLTDLAWARDRSNFHASMDIMEPDDPDDAAVEESERSRAQSYMRQKMESSSPEDILSITQGDESGVYNILNQEFQD